MKTRNNNETTLQMCINAHHQVKGKQNWLYLRMYTSIAYMMAAKWKILYLLSSKHYRLKRYIDAFDIKNATKIMPADLVMTGDSMHMYIFI